MIIQKAEDLEWRAMLETTVMVAKEARGIKKEYYFIFVLKHIYMKIGMIQKRGIGLKICFPIPFFRKKKFKTFFSL